MSFELVDLCWGQKKCDEISILHWLEHHSTAECNSLAWALTHHGEMKFKHLCECYESWIEDDQELLTCFFDLFPIDVQIAGCGDYKYDRNNIYVLCSILPSRLGQYTRVCSFT